MKREEKLLKRTAILGGFMAGDLCPFCGEPLLRTEKPRDEYGIPLCGKHQLTLRKKG